MPIREIFADRIEQDCIACGGVRHVALSALTAAAGQGGQAGRGLLQLPSCPSCGAVEFLVASGKAEPEHPAPGSFGHKHQLLVDVLHARAIVAGHAEASGHPPELAAETLEKWFPHGLRLEGLGCNDPQEGEQ